MRIAHSAVVALAASLYLPGGVPRTFAEPPGGSLAAALPDTPQARCARAFIESINAGTTSAVREFEDTFAGKARQQRSSIDDRVGRLMKLSEQWGKIRLANVLASSPVVVSIIVEQDHGAPIALEFSFDQTDGTRFDAVGISPASEMTASREINAQERAKVIEGACKALEDGYVYPDIAARMAANVREKLAKGGYDSVTDEATLAATLERDFRSVNNDGHLRVRLRPAPPSMPQHDMNEMDEMRRENYSFRKAELLPDNIGYLRFDAFVEGEEAQRVASAAMNFLARCDALIIDMRYNGGGSPEMIRYITSYLFDDRTHLNDMVDRNGEVVGEFWTMKDVPGDRLGGSIPVYVLTSGRTFSGAEEFSYNLKNLKRATIVGQTTGGGAHPVRGQRIDDRFMIGVPFMRARNPISGTNWEGTGVAPDVDCKSDVALDRALELARKAASGQQAAK